MSRQNKKILRATQKYIALLGENIVFKTSHISTGGKLCLIGILLCFVALFMPWISPVESISSTTSSLISSFSLLLGGVGFFILVSLILMAFSIISIKKKEKILFLSRVRFSDFLLNFWGAIFILILNIHIFLLIAGLHRFSINISYDSGLILSTTGAFIILAGSIVLKSEYRKNVKGSYISELQTNIVSGDNTRKKSNMKLPF